ncbi:hypothetical protein NDU88_003178 [Pleurodeles waltl]|uniref:Uncharacterized protein n=1 Tax=Pleurodeles waltl TaxID=8319 RepID=A0AAV7WNN3_PLEWA|nr:hypothetical protein NDU88_003178 [Pleurodeles waltl]
MNSRFLSHGKIAVKAYYIPRRIKFRNMAVVRRGADSGICQKCITRHYSVWRLLCLLSINGTPLISERHNLERDTFLNARQAHGTEVKLEEGRRGKVCLEPANAMQCAEEREELDR